MGARARVARSWGCDECEAAPPREVGWPLGVALASGAPALVLVAAAPIALLVGPPSVVVWAASAVVGMLMAIVFAELAAVFPGQGGGVATLAAAAFKPRRPFLALVGQWSYWVGWSPAMAISAGLIGEYVHDSVAPQSTGWVAWLIATALLVLSAFLNHFGIRACARVQVLLVTAALAAVALLTVLPLLGRGPVSARLVPFAPPDGWASWGAPGAILGGLFLAGWSAYAAEIALTYGPEHRDGVRGAVRSLLVTGMVMVGVCTVLPLALYATVGASAPDPEGTLALLRAGADPVGSAVLPAVALVALLLGLNTIAIGDSRLLCQMARNGDAWAFLGRLNDHGVPANALLFDVVANAGLLALALVITGGSVATIPVTLLTAANVGYLTSLSLALVATWLARRERPEAPRAFRAPRGFVTGGLALAGFNALLILGAGAAWGWRNVALGVVLLAGVLAVFCAPWRRVALGARLLAGGPGD